MEDALRAERRRRSCLSVPAGDSRKLLKARNLDVDEIILDLEDSIPPAAKPSALIAARKAVAHWSGPPLSVRVNAPGTPYLVDELSVLAGLTPPPGSIVVPKVNDADDLVDIDQMITAAGDVDAVRLEALIESADGLANVARIAAAVDRLDALILGYADLAAELGRPPGSIASLDLWLPAQHAVVLAARRHRLQAIDGPHLGTAPDAAFQASATRARDLGFDGKWAIHPSQIEALNAVFSPSQEEVDHARAVVDALDNHGSASGVAALDGQMIDEAVRRSALRVLSRAGCAAGTEG